MVPACVSGESLVAQQSAVSAGADAAGRQPEEPIARARQRPAAAADRAGVEERAGIGDVPGVAYGGACLPVSATPLVTEIRPDECTENGSLRDSLASVSPMV